MTIEDRLSKLTHAQIVETVHLISRYLAEIPRTRVELSNILAVDATGGPQVVAAVLGIVDDIEREEHQPIEGVPAEKRREYVVGLDRFLWSRIHRDGTGSDVEGALEELRKVS